MKIETYKKKAAEGWKITETDEALIFYRDNVGDGFPFAVHLVVVNGKVKDAFLLNDSGRGDGPEEHKIGIENAARVLENLHNPYRYKTWQDAWLATNPPALSEKVLGERINVAERQLRNARIMGFFLDDFIVDRLCVKVLGRNPTELYSYEAWAEFRSAEELEAAAVASETA